MTDKALQKEAEEAAKKALDFSFDKNPPKDLGRIRRHYRNGYIAGRQSREQDQLTIQDYEESFESHKQLVRELDVMMNGEDGAAKQASLCDIVAQFPKWKAKKEAYYEQLITIAAGKIAELKPSQPIERESKDSGEELWDKFISDTADKRASEVPVEAAAANEEQEQLRITLQRTTDDYFKMRDAYNKLYAETKGKDYVRDVLDSHYGPRREKQLSGQEAKAIAPEIIVGVQCPSCSLNFAHHPLPIQPSQLLP